MASFANTEHLNSVLSYIIVKKLLTRIENTNAYKLGLVDTNGITVKVPESDDEKLALTLLDKFIFKIKRMLGPRANQLSNFLYVNSLEGGVEEFLTVKGGAQNKSAVKRVTDDLKALSEKYNMSTDDLIKYLIWEEVKNA